MKLTYRGISYSSNLLIHQANMKHTQFHSEIKTVRSKNHPWLQYFKQIFLNQKNSPKIFNPRKFWQQQKIEKLESCWRLNYHIELFKICWYLEAIQPEYAAACLKLQSDRPQTKVKLKYRGVTYYR